MDSPAPHRVLGGLNSAPTAYVPVEGDVREARKIVASLGFPAELVLEILEYARYWPEVTHESVFHTILLDQEWSLESSGARLYLWAWLPQQATRFPNENPKMREIEFTIVSHDQGWTTENTKGSYETSSWFEASIFRHLNPHDPPYQGSPTDHMEMEWANLELARLFYMKNRGWKMVPRPTSEMEPQRNHCEEMRKVTWTDKALAYRKEMFEAPIEKPGSQGYWQRKTYEVTDKCDELDEGKHSWWLQGNQVARSTSIFEGEMVKRYRVVWGCKDNPNWKGDAGAGSGTGFLDSLQKDDAIVVWSRAKAGCMPFLIVRCFKLTEVLRGEDGKIMSLVFV